MVRMKRYEITVSAEFPLGEPTSLAHDTWAQDILNKLRQFDRLVAMEKHLPGATWYLTVTDPWGPNGTMASIYRVMSAVSLTVTYSIKAVPREVPPPCTTMSIEEVL